LTVAGQTRSITVLALSAVAVFVALLCAEPTLMGGRPQSENNKLPAPAYDPYPPGILPSDLSFETARVLREIVVVEARALARWHALKPPLLTGQPPVFQNTGTEFIETLGELMLFDKNMSPRKNEACASCHMPYAGFSGPNRDGPLAIASK
jgi:cytochrome c peroxidase